jgi:hypothetical protein
LGLADGINQTCTILEIRRLTFPVRCSRRFPNRLGDRPTFAIQAIADSGNIWIGDDNVAHQRLQIMTGRYKLAKRAARRPEPIELVDG